MAEKQLDSKALTCPICLDLLESPVTISCGHSFCMKCLKYCWCLQQLRYKCPQCRKRFTSRPALNKNIMLADLVEQLKKSEPSSDRYAGPQDVSCEVCTGRKLKAVKSCLQCVVSFCDSHLQPHRDVAMLKKHQLVAPSNKLQENICHEHNKLKEIFCRTDQLLICYLCCIDQHKGHDTVSSAAERAQRQEELEAKTDLLKNRVQHKEADQQRLQQEAQDISRCAQRAVQRSGDMFKEVIQLLEKRRSEVEEQIHSDEQIQLGRVQKLQDQLQQDVTELKRSISELEELSNSPDHNQFILRCPLLSTDPETTESKDVKETEDKPKTRHQRFFEPMTRPVTALTEKLQLALRQVNTEPEAAPEPTTREDFLRHAQEINLDPKTANANLTFENGKLSLKDTPMKWTDHMDRFMYWGQVLSKSGMMGRSYWEVRVSEAKHFCLAVSYKDIEREDGSAECAFGYNEKSWALERDNKKFSFCFDSVQTEIPGPECSTVGVYLDHSAGVLYFYSVSEDTMTLIHKVQTTFTQPLYAGLRLSYNGDSVELPRLERSLIQL